MTFRNESGLEPLVVTADTPSGLERRINQAGATHDLIDMQYSTTDNGAGGIEYSALLLVRQKETRRDAKGGK